MAVQWRQILADALEHAEFVVVGEVVRRRLERQPTRSEITAARRAANRYANAGHAVAMHVKARSGAGKRDRHMLVLARPDTDLGQGETQTDVVPGDPRAIKPSPDEAIARMLSKTVRAAGRTARQLDVDTISPGAARVFEADIGEAMKELERLRGRLVRRSEVTRVVAD